MKKRVNDSAEIEVPVEVVDGGAAEPIHARLVYQYRRVEDCKGRFVREATAFGVMLMEAEKSFSTAVEKYKTSKKGRWGEGRPNSGIEGWLAENCPEICYKTAMSYKALAQKAITLMGGPSPAVLAALAAPGELQVSYETAANKAVNTVPEVVIDAREAIFADATSRRKLEQMYFDFERRQEKAEMMAQSSAKPLPKLSKQEASEKIWSDLMFPLGKTTTASAILFLRPSFAQMCYERLAELCRMMKDQATIKE